VQVEQPAGTTKLTGANGSMEIGVIRTFGELERLAPEWDELHRAVCCRNPFAGSTWPAMWARHFLDERDLYVITVRKGGLKAVVPMYVERRAAGRIRDLRLMATAHHVRLLELPQALVDPTLQRRLFRSAIETACGCPERWMWLEMCLGHEHGWFEPQWIPEAERAAGSFVIHKGTRACVVMDLPPDQKTFLSQLKRNARESVRRSHNRLSRAGAWEVEAVSTGASPSDIEVALDTIARLHRERVALAGKVAHSDYLKEPGTRTYLGDVAAWEVPRGGMDLRILRLDGVPIAGLVTLRSNDSIYISLSGLEPAKWDLGPVTALLASAMSDAIDAGARHVNLSPGPDVPKLRWSEKLEIANDFVLVNGRPAASAAFTVMWSARAFVNARTEAKRQRKPTSQASHLHTPLRAQRRERVEPTPGDATQTPNGPGA
jgi:CelD/BcsL family acetyltransferase involved in cellulose biosynthesis